MWQPLMKRGMALNIIIYVNFIFFGMPGNNSVGASKQQPNTRTIGVGDRRQAGIRQAASCIVGILYKW